MTPILSRAEAADLVVAARVRAGLTWTELAEELGTPPVWTTASLLDQHPMTAEQASAVCARLGLDEPVAVDLQQQSTRAPIRLRPTTRRSRPSCAKSSATGS